MRPGALKFPPIPGKADEGALTNSKKFGDGSKASLVRCIMRNRLSKLIDAS
jgi:hypothetical protein